MTLLGHAACGLAAYGVLRPAGRTPWGMSRRTAILACSILPMLPDLDVIGHLWVSYGDTLGHRGVFHSLAVATLAGVAVAWALQRLGKIEKTRRALVVASIVFSGLVGSHGLTDAMTTGGKPIMLLWPLSTDRLWLPWRFVPVSPFGTSLLRTKWSPEQLRGARRYRREVLAGRHDTHVLVREVVGLSERPDHARRLAVAGIFATELVLLAPLFVVGGVRWILRRRAGPDPPASETAPAPEPAPRPVLPLVATRALGATALAALAVALALGLSDHGVETLRYGALSDAFRTPWVRVAPDPPPRGAPIAVLVHGWRCSHQMMLPLARMLANNGVVAYAIDLPGHGASPVPLDLSCRRGAREPCLSSSTRAFDVTLRPVVEALAAEERFGDRPTVLVGHSTGAIAVHDVRGPFAERLRARIVLEGRIARVSRRGNVLVVGDASYLGAFGLPVDDRMGRFEDGTATLLFTSRRSHLAIVHSARINGEVLRWIRGATGAPVGRDPDAHFGAHRSACGLLFLAALLGLHAALAEARRRGRLAVGPPASAPRPGIALTCVLLGGVPAALYAGELAGQGSPWISFAVRLTLPWFLLAASLWVAMPYAIFAWRPKDLRPAALARDVGLGVAAFALVYLGAGLWADAHFWHARIGLHRVPLWLGWTAAMLPVALVLREVGPRGPGLVPSLLRFALRMALWAGLVWVHAAGFPGAHRREVLGLIGLVAIAEIAASAPAWHAESRLAGAVTVSLTVSWFFATAYPLLASTTAG